MEWLQFSLTIKNEHLNLKLSLQKCALPHTWHSSLLRAACSSSYGHWMAALLAQSSTDLHCLSSPASISRLLVFFLCVCVCIFNIFIFITRVISSNINFLVNTVIFQYFAEHSFIGHIYSVLSEMFARAKSGLRENQIKKGLIGPYEMGRHRSMSGGMRS